MTRLVEALTLAIAIAALFTAVLLLETVRPSRPAPRVAGLS
jgi:hypothetical protein